MTELLTAAQMRAIEQAAIARGEATGLELMERAGRGVVEAIFDEWPELAKTAHRAVVLCGPGNNGGDGFVVARLLKEWGWEVEVYLYGDPAKLPPDARVNHQRWCGMGAVEAIAEFAARKAWHCDIIVDALFGTGLTRPFEGQVILDLLYELSDATSIRQDTVSDFEASLKTPPVVVAVDLPSGLDSDSGRVVGGKPPFGARAARASICVTFHRAKLGHHLADGPLLCGKLVIKDIGL